jgi:hypothetical protein
MKLANLYSLVLLAVLAGAVAASCSAVSDKTGFTGTGASSGSAGTGMGHGGAGGNLVFNDGGLSDAPPDHHGPTTCDVSCGAAGGTCMGGTCVLSDNPGSITGGVQTQLAGGGTADAAFTWLYPYDHTVFPRGLLPPLLQFGGTAPDAVYVHVSFPGMDYKGYYGSSSPGRVTFAAPVWKAITLAASGQPDVKVDVTKVSSGKVTGPITETWTIAPGSLRGTIYYETYDSQILGGIGSVGIMKIQPGAMAPALVKNGCGNVCHTASADGSTLVAAQTLLSSASYDLKSNAATIYVQNNDFFTYGGIYPDGSFVVSATDYRTWLNNPSRLYDVKTGVNIPTPSWDGLITRSGTPAFAPDGKQIVFNHEDNGAGHTLAVMAYNHATNVFSGIHDVATDPSRILGFPAFTPDGKWVVYHAGTNPQFETDNMAQGNIFFTSSTSPMIARLDALDGYASTKVYLPASDPDLNFAPTVLPEAAGGYFWVVFTSHRSYGNTLPSLDGPAGMPGEYGKLWVSAFDIAPVPGKDPSHPAFFLDGQELHSDNLRGFWVLDPCKQNGNLCTTGDECCGGYCRSDDGGPSMCVPPPGGCSNEFEKCTTASDCCDSTFVCINGHCAQPPIQ